MKKKKHKKYNIIYADPPWPSSNAYGFGTKREKRYDYNIRYHPCGYKLMTSDEILNLPVERIASKDCILFLWTINWRLPLALSVIKKWDFEYKTIAFIWSKRTSRGKLKQLLGQYTMSNCEICLLATRGHPHRFVRKRNIKQFVIAPFTKHSCKPNEVRKRIINLVGDRPRIELFARIKHIGWDVWGNEVKSDIQLKTRKGK